ncbi:MAG: tRNA 2-thiouridine(34) synthase MnmA [Patescibacteria group bacterium]
MKNKKVALGLSGGVDSAVCAHLLKEQGYDITTIYIECWNEPGCRAEQDKKDALKIALKLNIPFKTLDFKKAYKEKIIEYFFSEYKQGKTPNPDVLCNKEIKFGLFYDWALENGFDFIATGHYAAIAANNKLQAPNNKQLLTPKDKHKDQTYFLHQITKEQLKHTLFPLQNLSKEEVRNKAIELKLHIADKKDSVGICFIGDVDVQKMLREKFGKKPGDVVDINNNIIGKHKGLWFYTIGQRSGFTIEQKNSNIPPFYVIAKDIKKNQLVVGFGTETLKSEFQVTNLHFSSDHHALFFAAPRLQKRDGDTSVHIKQKLFVRIRHTGKLLPCKVRKISAKGRPASGWEVKLEEAQRGIAAGQFAVFYTPNKYLVSDVQYPTYICLGGGVIS